MNGSPFRLHLLLANVEMNRAQKSTLADVNGIIDVIRAPSMWTILSLLDLVELPKWQLCANRMNNTVCGLLSFGRKLGNAAKVAIGCESNEQQDLCSLLL